MADGCKKINKGEIPTYPPTHASYYGRFHIWAASGILWRPEAQRRAKNFPIVMVVHAQQTQDIDFLRLLAVKVTS